MKLLIEPVWNRNDVKVFIGGIQAAAFNRTSMESKQTKGVVETKAGSLLIEPVWNRNAYSQLVKSWICSSFNRTSMESKLFNR